jgi:uncharacterized protein (DUF2164 family)
MAIELSQEVRKQLRASVQRYGLENLDQDIGDLKADMLLDYSLTEIGPTVYNQAISDAQTYFQGRVADLEGVCYEKEFTYWVQPSVTRKTR